MGTGAFAVGDKTRIAKQLLVRSIIVALLVGPLVGLVGYLRFVHRATRYEPPLTEAEWQQLMQLPMAQAEVILRPRTKVVTRTQWLMESAHHSFFWKELALGSIAPTLGIFLASLFVGRLQIQKGTGSEN